MSNGKRYSRHSVEEPDSSLHHVRRVKGGKVVRLTDYEHDSSRCSLRDRAPWDVECVRLSVHRVDVEVLERAENLNGGSLVRSVG